jgi:hypothetical protein
MIRFGTYSTICFTYGDDMAHRGLTGAVLYAKDLHQLVQFYTAGASLDLQKIEEGFAILGREPSQLVIVRIPKRIAAAIQIATPPERREDTPIKLVFAAEDIASAKSGSRVGRHHECCRTRMGVRRRQGLRWLRSRGQCFPDQAGGLNSLTSAELPR